MGDGADRRGDGERRDDLFASLPSSRPGTRSPRRRSQGDAKPPPPAGEEERPEAPAPRGAAAKPADPEPAETPSPPGPAAGEQGGLEDIAWAGVAAAAEAATLGVRLATRALEAVRDAASRR